MARADLSAVDAGWYVCREDVARMKWLTYLPTVISIVKETMEAVEAPGHGPEKKKAVLEALAAWFPLWPGIPGDDVLRVAGALIDVFVAVNNITGRFRKGVAAT